MNRWFALAITIAAVLLTATLAATSALWAPPLLEFAGANSDTIQGLTGLIEIVLWAGSAVVFVVGLWWVRKTPTGGIMQQNSGDNARLVAVQPGGVYVEKQDIHQPPDPADVAAQTAALYARYLHTIIKRCYALPLAALGGESSAGDEEITLDKVYIALDTTTSVPLTAAEKQARKERTAIGEPDERRAVPALEAATQTRRLALLGDPGSGKSTFVHYLAAQLAAARLGEGAPPAGWPADLTPILTVLRDVAGRLTAAHDPNLAVERQRAAYVAALDAHWQEQLAQGKLAGAWPALAAALESGRVLLVFDGLDEVPEAARACVWGAVNALSHAYGKLHAIIVTCRIRSYDEKRALRGFTSYTLAGFDAPKIKNFVAAWYKTQAELHRIPANQQATRTQDLQSAALEPDLRELAQNPMLLTVMAIIHQRDVGLPRERVRLYREAVKVLTRRWQEQRGIPVSPELRAVLRDESKLRRILEQLAYTAHSKGHHGKRDAGMADLLRGELLILLEKPEHLGHSGLASDFLDYVDQRAGLLVGRGGAGDDEKPLAYTFPHRTFQEYLAGCHLLGQPSVSDAFVQHADAGDRWHLAAEYGLEELWYNREIPEFAFSLLAFLGSGGMPTTPRGWRLSLWAGHLAAVIGGDELTLHSFRLPPDQEIGGAAFVQQLRERMVAIMRSSPLPALERAEAGRLLARLVDHRVEVMNPRAIAWQPVPAGPFLMGSPKGKGDDDETPQHTVDIPYPYRIARYPITNAQYRVFVADGGYGVAAWWREAAQHGYWKAGRFTGYSRTTWEEDLHRLGAPFTLDNHPAVNVSWYEALAFARWLNDALHRERRLEPDWCVRLPTEAEWEKAARSDDGRTYPWGEGIDDSRANFEAARIGATSAVGCFPRGASPYAVEECAGNVWEWTNSRWQGYPYDPSDGREETSEYKGRVIRGGAFNYSANGVRCGFRGWGYPDLWSRSYGFRVVASPFTSGLCPSGC